MRFMEWIRKHGSTCLAVFLVVFLVSVFAGLGVGMFNFNQMSGGTPGNQQPAELTIAVDEEMDAVIRVNGEEISREHFERELRNLQEYFRSQNQDDQGTLLMAYGFAAGRVIEYAATSQRGDELGITVTSEDIAQEKEQAINQYMSTEEGSTGNLLGDLAKTIGSSAERREAFETYLKTMGMDEGEWRNYVKWAIKIRKTREKMQELADEEKQLEAEKTKALIDERLAEGESFEDLANEYSELQSAEPGQAFWMGRDLALPEQEEAVFNTPAGELTDWIEVPAGYYRFEIIEHKKAEGEEFEESREDLVEKVKKQHPDDEDYEPSEEEIQRAFEQVRVRQLMVSTNAQGGAQERAARLVEAAKVEVNDPYVLAYQALYDTKLQPPASFGYDDLVEIARTAAVGDGYEFELIRAKLENADKQRAEARAELAGEEPAADDTADNTDGDATESGEEPADTDSDAVTADDAAADEASAADAPADTETAAATEETAAAETADADAEAAADEPADDETPDIPDEQIPAYALAIGLFKIAIQEKDDRVTYFPYYIIGDTYLEWMDDTDNLDRQPVDRATAREEAELNFSRAAERYEYSSMLHAQRALNLARLEREEEALESAALAEKYALQQHELPVWDILRDAYKVLDNQERLDALEEMVAEYRRAELKQQLDQMQSEQQGVSDEERLRLIEESLNAAAAEEGTAESGEPAEDAAEEGTAGETAEVGDGTATAEETEGTGAEG